MELIPQNSSSGTSIKIEVETTEPLTETQYLSYVYWRNNQPSRESREVVIPSTSYKKNDLIVVDVYFYEGEEVLAKRRSDQTMIPNTAPVIVDVKVPKVDGPGIYTFTTQATDADDDALTFTLKPNTGDETLPEGLAIDSNSGVVTYTLKEDTPPAEVVQFVIAADDSDGGIAQKVVTLNFELTKPVKQENTAGKKENTNPKKSPTPGPQV